MCQADVFILYQSWVVLWDHDFDRRSDLILRLFYINHVNVNVNTASTFLLADCDANL